MCWLSTAAILRQPSILRNLICPLNTRLKSRISAGGPCLDGAAPFGWRYGSALALGPEERVTPLAAPGANVTVADLLP